MIQAQAELTDDSRALFRAHASLFDPDLIEKSHDVRFKGDERARIYQAIDFFIANAGTDWIATSYWFEPSWYVERFPAEQTPPENALAAMRHFIWHGLAAGASASPYFDAHYYIDRYASVRTRLNSGETRYALQDYLERGLTAGLNPNAWFEERWYLARYADVGPLVADKSVRSGYHHYLSRGMKMRRDPGPKFSERRYGGTNQDVLEAITAGVLPAAFDHWLRHGAAENRSLGHPLLMGSILTGAC